MIGCHELKYFYTTAPRTGTASVCQFLRKQYKGKSIARWHRTIIPEEYRSYFRFMTIRDPYQRLVSLWWWCHAHKKDPRKPEDRNKDKSFGGFLEWLIPNQYRKLYDEECMIWSNQSTFYDCANIQHHMMLADIDNEVHKLPFANPDKHNETVPRHPHRTDLERQAWQSYYNKRTERLAYAHSGPDFDRFGFKRERFRVNG